ncbi:hypothetical protein ACFQEX_04935 [Roseibium salinum]|uniref:hypothetical protein n=1 Tax=Roseibium salinum TaxID=1604349 RepID=UPI003610A9CE
MKPPEEKPDSMVRFLSMPKRSDRSLRTSSKRRLVPEVARGCGKGPRAVDTLHGHEGDAKLIGHLLEACVTDLVQGPAAMAVQKEDRAKRFLTLPGLGQVDEIFAVLKFARRLLAAGRVLGCKAGGREKQAGDGGEAGEGMMAFRQRTVSRIRGFVVP